jgi:hypothetical protein
MGGDLSRRLVLALGGGAIVAHSLGPVFRASRARSVSEHMPMSYQDRLAAAFERDDVPLTLMTMAHLGGFADQLPAWLARAKEKNPRLDVEGLQRLHAALLAGDAGRIEDALRRADLYPVLFPLDKKERAKADWMDSALRDLSSPLALLGLGDTLAGLHRNSLRRLGAGWSKFTANAALILAAAGDWDRALEILVQARDSGVRIHEELRQEQWLWQFAYLHRQAERVLPVLATIPFRPDAKHLVDFRAWQLKAFQIRAGMAVDVPLIEGEQPTGYYEAVAMQIAALDGDARSADRVAELRRVLRLQPMEIHHVQRNIAMVLDWTEQAMAKAPARIAARRKDYAKAEALARRPAPALDDSASIVIDAFLEEGDWRGAAEIAKDHDPRKLRVPRGFDDTRAGDYVERYKLLAVAAAWSGDDAAAAGFLAKAREQKGAAVNWTETLLTGVAEGLLPRKRLHVLASAFRYR